MSLCTLPDKTVGHKTLLKEAVVTESLRSRAQVTGEQQQHTELEITTTGLRVAGGGESEGDASPAGEVQEDPPEGPTASRLRAAL